jgi:hypothetical protein
MINKLDKLYELLEEIEDNESIDFLQEMELFIILASNGKRPDGTYNYSREELEKRAKVFLKPEG